MPFVLQRGHPNSRFIDPVISRLLNELQPNHRDVLLYSYLASPETYAITSDDKTLFIAMRRRLVEFGAHKIIPLAAEVSPPDPRKVPKPVQPSEPVKVTPPKPSTTRWASLAIVLSIIALIVAVTSAVLSIFVYLDWHRPAPAPVRPPSSERQPSHTPTSRASDPESKRIEPYYPP